MKTLQENDFKMGSVFLGAEVAALKAVADVESLGGGFLPNGLPKILFEGHVFWRELQKIGISPYSYQDGNQDILYKSWTSKHYVGGTGEHARLQKAVRINRNAALKSASWGKFQIMGFNYERAGFKDFQEFINGMYNSESDHLVAFCNFIKSDTRLLNAIRKKDWASFALYYNGKGYKKNRYDEKLLKAYRKHL